MDLALFGRHCFASEWGEGERGMAGWHGFRQPCRPVQTGMLRCAALQRHGCRNLFHLPHCSSNYFSSSECDLIASMGRGKWIAATVQASVPCPPLQHHVSGSIATEPLLPVGPSPQRHGCCHLFCFSLPARFSTALRLSFVCGCTWNMSWETKQIAATVQAVTSCKLVCTRTSIPLLQPLARWNKADT